MTISGSPPLDGEDIHHVFPVNDLREHVTEGWMRGLRCWCHPEVMEEGRLIVHNALDQRERYETGELKPH